jgi:hypothetical protein
MPPEIDITGHLYGRLRVLNKTGKRSARNKILWLCRCECGSDKTLEATSKSLRDHKRTSCGCIKSETMRKVGKQNKIPIKIGSVFGYLKVIGQSKSSQKSYEWICQCFCGKEVLVTGFCLRKGRRISCGCNRMANWTLPDGESSFRRLCRSYKANAIRRSLTFSLGIDDIKWLSKQPCWYCGKEPSQIIKSSGNTVTARGIEKSIYIYNGIDRKDNSKGYEIDNCVSCCGRCNRAKLAMSYEDFLELVKLIYKNLNLDLSSN